MKGKTKQIVFILLVVFLFGPVVKIAFNSFNLPGKEWIQNA